MSDITVVGLGAMGSALAHSLLKAGREITVWNRSPDKVQPLVALGARVSSNLNEGPFSQPQSYYMPSRLRYDHKSI